MTYCDVMGGWTGAGNIDADPLFVNLLLGDLHLGLGSPCIDAGNNAAPSIPDIDMDGDPRFVEGGPPSFGTLLYPAGYIPNPTTDMGADEYYDPVLCGETIFIKQG